MRRKLLKQAVVGKLLDKWIEGVNKDPHLYTIGLASPITGAAIGSAWKSKEIDEGDEDVSNKDKLIAQLKAGAKGAGIATGVFAAGRLANIGLTEAKHQVWLRYLKNLGKNRKRAAKWGKVRDALGYVPDLDFVGYVGGLAAASLMTKPKEKK